MRPFIQEAPESKTVGSVRLCLAPKLTLCPAKMSGVVANVFAISPHDTKAFETNGIFRLVLTTYKGGV